jgi:hypothetical protein
MMVADAILEDDGNFQHGLQISKESQFAAISVNKSFESGKDFGALFTQGEERYENFSEDVS